MPPWPVMTAVSAVAWFGAGQAIPAEPMPGGVHLPLAFPAGTGLRILNVSDLAVESSYTPTSPSKMPGQPPDGVPYVWDDETVVDRMALVRWSNVSTDPRSRPVRLMALR